MDKKKDDIKLTVALTGRLDTITAPELETSLKDDIDGVTELDFDFSNLEYISSAGLRVLLSAQKIMNKQGSTVVKNANDMIKDAFDVTGFSDILKVE
ncbi:MAG: STAS domain-containing protein [Lachnospiraceae bacterium]|nr:STAS domain-containing protein [Lachnospiraceae bacterium]